MDDGDKKWENLLMQSLKYHDVEEKDIKTIKNKKLEENAL